MLTGLSLSTPATQYGEYCWHTATVHDTFPRSLAHISAAIRHACHAQAPKSATAAAVNCQTRRGSPFDWYKNLRTNPGANGAAGSPARTDRIRGPRVSFLRIPPSAPAYKRKIRADHGRIGCRCAGLPFFRALSRVALSFPGRLLLLRVAAGSIEAENPRGSRREKRMDRDGESKSRPEAGFIEPANEEVSLMKMGDENFGCAHYRRRCKIRAPCCDQIFDCRHCHNEAKNSMQVDPLDRHEIPRHEIKRVICSLCCTEQDVQQNCINCGVCMGEYFCEKCKFFDDDVSKRQYHCDGCGICRTGGEENFFHCHKCGCCYALTLKDSHRCVERAMHHNCPVCFEYLFDSTKGISVLRCGHTIHFGCLEEMQAHFQFACPVCSKSMGDMSRVWEKLDREVSLTPMPEIYKNKMVWILCNDCGTNSEVNFHFVAHKCPTCNSYNTKQTRGGPVPCSAST